MNSKVYLAYKYTHFKNVWFPFYNTLFSDCDDMLHLYMFIMHTVRGGPAYCHTYNLDQIKTKLNEIQKIPTFYLKKVYIQWKNLWIDS
jgi:hypothetical protein